MPTDPTKTGMRPSASAHYWLGMFYGCGHCGTEWAVLLEDGCEGPRTGTPIEARLPDDHPAKPGEAITIHTTPAGRPVVPVPFIIGRCPNDAHMVQHTRWADDWPVDYTGTPDGPHFRYPELTRRQRRSGYTEYECGVPTGWPPA